MIETGWYRHFKGELYRVIGEGVHTETRERLVIYEANNSEILQVRLYDMFFEEVAPGVKRFTKV